MMIDLHDVDLLRRAAHLYLHSSEAQHGDEELAFLEAELWSRLFAEAALDDGLDEEE